MSRDISSRLIYRYLAGECTPLEKEEVEEWIRSSEKNRLTMHSLEKIWRVEPKKELEADIAVAWEKLEENLKRREMEQASRMNNRKLELLHGNPQRGFRIRATVGLRVAAVISLIALTSLFATLYLFESVPEEPVAWKEVITEKGQRAQIVLDDGSRIRMNADSKIIHPAEFGPDDRVVHLSGEAYFEVVRDGRPFFVFADEAVIEILGTEFNVMAYKQEEIRVTVAGGKVSVRHQDAVNDRTVYLERGDMASLQRDAPEEIMVSRGVDLQRHLGWLEYRLEFDAAPLDHVLRSLERWYEMEFEVKDPSLSDLRFTAVFEDESIDEILEAMKLSLNLEIEMEENRINIYKVY